MSRRRRAQSRRWRFGRRAWLAQPAIHNATVRADKSGGQRCEALLGGVLVGVMFVDRRGAALTEFWNLEPGGSQ